MRRITLFFVSTVAIIVLLFSYKTSGPAQSLQASTAGGAAHIVSGPAVAVRNSVTTSAPPPDPATTRGPSVVRTTAKARARNKATPKATAAPKTTAPPKTTAAPKTPAPPTQTAPVVVDGAAVDTNYGPVQVQVTIANKKITNVAVPQYPTGTGLDQEINSVAIPQLVAEVLSAQSATIDAVSGATYTTQGFQASLQSALDAAHFGS